MCGNKTQAARLSQVHHATVYSANWKADEAFQAGLGVAEECAAELIEAEAFQRAVDGVEKPTGWYKGVAGGMIREYSDILAIFLSKGLRPERYQERVGGPCDRRNPVGRSASATTGPRDPLRPFPATPAGLDVAMDDTLLVRVVEGRRHRLRNLDGLLHAELRFAVELVPQRLAVDERHHVIEE